LHCIVFYVEDA